MMCTIRMAFLWPCILLLSHISFILNDESPIARGKTTMSYLEISKDRTSSSSIKFGGNKSYAIGTDSRDIFTISQDGSPIVSIDTLDDLTLNMTSLSSKNIDLHGDFKVLGTPQFKTIAIETFFQYRGGDWLYSMTNGPFDNNNVTRCGGRYILGGFGKLAAGEINKTFTDLPAHAILRVRATVHFIDKWSGESCYLKMDLGKEGEMEYVWTESNYSNERGINICGGSHGESKFAVNVDIAVPHSSNSVKLAFGSTIKHDNKMVQSWGISLVELIIR